MNVLEFKDDLRLAVMQTLGSWLTEIRCTYVVFSVAV